MPLYAHANVRFCTTLTVAVLGAMFDETTHWCVSRATIARQCCMRFARA